MNDFKQYVKFFNYSVENIPFFNLKVGLNYGKIVTDLYVKPADRHQYLHSSSAHLKHTEC